MTRVQLDTELLTLLKKMNRAELNTELMLLMASQHQMAINVAIQGLNNLSKNNRETLLHKADFTPQIERLYGIADELNAQ